MAGTAFANRRTMRDMQLVIEELLARWPAGFRNKHLAQALGVSRSRASRVLKALLRSGELARVGEELKRYVRGPDCGRPHGGVARASPPNGFWRRLVQDCPTVAYVALGNLDGPGLRTRQQARALLRGVDNQSYLVVDFEGLHSVSETACQEFLVKLPRRRGIAVQPINLEPAVAQTAWHVLRTGHL